MANKREQRIRRKARAALRRAQRDLDAASSWRPIALAAIAYVDEIYEPNLKEPFSIKNRRLDLVATVRMYQARATRATRRAA